MMRLRELLKERQRQLEDAQKLLRLEQESSRRLSVEVLQQRKQLAQIQVTAERIMRGEALRADNMQALPTEHKAEPEKHNLHHLMVHLPITKFYGHIRHWPPRELSDLPEPVRRELAFALGEHLLPRIAAYHCSADGFRDEAMLFAEVFVAHPDARPTPFLRWHIR